MLGVRLGGWLAADANQGVVWGIRPAAWERHTCKLRELLHADISFCNPWWRLCRFLQRVAEDRFAALDLHHTGKVAIAGARGFVRQMSPGCSEQQVRAPCNKAPTMLGRPSAVHALPLVVLQQSWQTANTANSHICPQFSFHIQLSDFASFLSRPSTRNAQPACRLCSTL